jgi:transposase
MRFIKLSETDLKSLQKGQRYGKHFLFRDRCQCLILSHHGHTIPQLIELFKVHRVTIYEWFNLWESGGIEALHKKPGQGRRPKLSPTNPQHVERARVLVENERQNLKAVVAKLSAELDIEMHPDTLKRFLKNLATLSADSANASKRVRTHISTLKAK